MTTTSLMPTSIDQVAELLRQQLYVTDRGLAVAIFLALKLQRPLFLEGEAGVGKTEIAKALAQGLNTELIRLQCYEGLDVNHAVYEWNHARQVLEIRMMEASGEVDRQAATADLFSERFLIKRPLLQAIDESREGSPVLLIDELDRADEEFEGFLLELLADFQITIPELGTYRAAHPPVVIITSNRTREIHDALKRRCLYYWIDYPDFQKEMQIVTTRMPDAPRRLAQQVTGFIQELRETELYKIPGVSETLDWTAALLALNQQALDPQVIDDTLGIMLKYQDDIEMVRGEPVRAMLERSQNRGPRRGPGWRWRRLVMAEAPVNLNQLVWQRREEILRLAAKHGATNVRVFGSVARGEAGPDSDVDFLVDVGPVHSSWFPGGLLANLEDLLGCRVDVVTETALHWYIRDQVLNEALPLKAFALDANPSAKGESVQIQNDTQSRKSHAFMDRDKLYLTHIGECIARVQRFVADGRESFMDSELIQDAVIRNLQLIGQSSLNLRAETRAAHPDINWSGIIGLRNILVHQYTVIDLPTVWGIIDEQLPDFKQSIESILRDSQDAP